MEKKIISALKNARFSGKGRQSLHIYTYVMRICKMLIPYVRLDHTLYSINYGIIIYIIVANCPETDGTVPKILDMSCSCPEFPLC